MVSLSPETLDAIDALRLHGRRTTNPVDLAFDATPADYAAVLGAVLVDPQVDVALVVHAPPDVDDPDEVADVLDQVAARHPATTIVSDRKSTRLNSSH